MTELTPTLARVLHLICQGHTSREIALETSYALDTVKDQTKVLLRLFNARNRTHLAALAVARGLVNVKDAAC